MEWGRGWYGPDASIKVNCEVKVGGGPGREEKGEERGGGKEKPRVS